MALTSVSRSAFSRKGTSLNMKPGVKTLSVGTIDVLGITLDGNSSIDINNENLRFINPSGTRTFAYEEDLLSGGLIKTELIPDIAITHLHEPSGADEAEKISDLETKVVQIGDIAIVEGITYINATGNNSLFTTDWSAFSVSHNSPKITNWDSAFTHSEVDGNGSTTNPHGVTALQTDAIPLVGTSALAGDIIPEGQSGTHDLGSSSIYFKTLYATKVQLGATSSISNSYNWDNIGSFLTGSPDDSDDYTVYIKSEIDDKLGGISPLESLNLLSSETDGSYIKIGRDDNEVLASDILGAIHFTSTDTNVIETNTELGHSQLENTHAKILAKTTGIIYNTVDGTENGTLNLEGTWQTDANLEFQTGFDALNTNFKINSDNSISVPLYDWDANDWEDEPLPETNFLKLFANATDKTLYYKTGTTGQNQTYEKKKLVVSSEVADGNAQSVNFNIINTVEIDTGALKIGGKIVDLDNIVTDFDVWSENKTKIEVEGNTADQIFNLPNITISKITEETLMPSDASLLNITVLLRWRLTSNTHLTESNSIEQGLVQIKKATEDDSGWKTIRNFFNSTGSYYTPKDVSTSGDMIVVDSTYTDSELMETTNGIRDLLKISDVVFNMRIKDIMSEQEKLILRDLSWGIRLYWR